MSEDTPDYVLEVLGGEQVFVRHTARHDVVRESISNGLPYRSLETLRERFDLSLAEAAAVLGMPLRTLARRKIAKRLAADESDRLYRVARVVAHAVETLGSEEKAAQWLKKPNRALGWVAPLEILDTDLGAGRVDTVLGRIDHGIVS